MIVVKQTVLHARASVSMEDARVAGKSRRRPLPKHRKRKRGE